MRRLWIHGAVPDVLLGWCWLPIALVVRACEPHPEVVHWLVGVILLVSFAHQPVTLGLVYGDPVQRTAHRRIYLWAPLVAAGLIVIGLNISFTLVAVLAALWNAEHTLMQRYGVMRIYGRKAGDDHGRLEKPMLIAWLITALLFIAAFVDLEGLIRRLGLGRAKADGVRTLAPLQGPGAVLFWVAVAVAAVLTVRWWRAERAIGGTGTPKLVYTLGTFGLVVMVMIDPLAGIAGYVAAHSIEYFGIVHSSLRTRRDDAPVARAARTGGRRARPVHRLRGGDHRRRVAHRVAVGRAAVRLRRAVPRRPAHLLRRLRLEAAPPRRGCVARHRDPGALTGRRVRGWRRSGRARGLAARC